MLPDDFPPAGPPVPTLLRMEAHNAARNVHRFYEIAVGPDLLGDLVVRVRHGRCGTIGRERVVAVAADDAAARAAIIGCLKRRRGALGRCGASYRVVSRP